MATVEVGEFVAGLKAWGERAHAATKTGVQEGGKQLQAVIETSLDRTHYPPVSEPGTPPAYRSGALHDSVLQRTVDLGTGFQQRVYPSTVYARIHELSGWAGRGHKSFLPERKYLQPSLDEFEPDFRPIMLDAWRGALPGG